MNTPTHTFDHVDHLLATIDSHSAVVEASFAHWLRHAEINSHDVPELVARLIPKG